MKQPDAWSSKNIEIMSMNYAAMHIRVTSQRLDDTSSELPRRIKQASRWPNKQQLRKIRKPSKILEMLDNLSLTQGKHPDFEW